MTLERGGLLLVQRYASTKSTTGGYTALEVLQKYRGFDGVAWPGELVRDVQLTNGLASLDELDRLTAYVCGIGSPEIDLVYCADETDTDLTGFRFLGYDVGYYCTEYLHYSVVLNELLYGTEPRLVQYASWLNTNLLFESAADARHLLKTRALMQGISVDLERGDESLDPIGIFAPMRLAKHSSR